jgi:SMC interacting uncharacterized protein involved in chromosome segregation
MDWLTFFTKIIESLAWPATLVWILYFFVYKHGSKLTRIIKVIKYKDFTAEFRELLDDARNESEKSSFVTDERPLTTEQISEIERIAQIKPALAIMEIWRQLETAASKTLEYVSDATSKKTTVIELLRALYKRGEIKESEFKLIEKLRAARNAAVHAKGEDNITLSEVIEYKSLAEALINKLKYLEDKLPTN